jgi:sensor histidine kinase YesM
MILLIIISVLLFVIVIMQHYYYSAQRRRYEKGIYQVALPYFKSQMNPHFIKNLLQSVNYLILFDDKRNASNCLKKFSTLVDHTLKYSEVQLISLDKEIALLENYLSLQHIRFSNKFDFIAQADDPEKATINVAPDICAEEVNIPPMVIQPFVENAIVHGLEPLKEKGWLTIKFFQDSKYLHCVVTDNGIGRKASAELHKRAFNGADNGISTKNITRRINIIKKIVGVDINLVISDLNKENESGTVVAISFPKAIDDMYEFKSVDFENLVFN